jgi:hypothetical protein
MNTVPLACLSSVDTAAQIHTLSSAWLLGSKSEVVCMMSRHLFFIIQAEEEGGAILPNFAV